MPYAVNQGVRIHYRIEGDGQPLVLTGPDRMLEALKQGAEAIPSLWGIPNHPS
jgi:hypothetical protein